MKDLCFCSLFSLLLGQASAGVVYLDYPDWTFPPGGPPAEASFQLLLNTPLNQNQGAEFIFKFQPPQVRFGREDSQAPTADVLSVGGFVQQLSLGSPIGPAQAWAASGLLASPQWESDGMFGFLGVRANPATDSSTYYYGWARIAYNPDSTITLFDWAYESTPNTPILAGAVPEPSTCLLLSFGMLSIIFFRKRDAETNRPQRTPGLRLGCMPDVRGARSLFLVVMRTSPENHERFSGEEFFSEKRRFGSLACVVACAIAVVHADAAVIDNFSQGAALLGPTNYLPAVVVLQTGLDTNSTIGGTRRLSAQTQNRATLQVDPVAGEISFEAVTNFGYFAVEYGTDSPLGVDLKADGSEAFLLTFSNVSMPGLWRGGYTFRVNGIGYDLLHDLASINGRGTVRIPFSHFSTAAQFVGNEVSLEASRVESQYRLVLDSIVTVNADTPPSLGVVTLVAGDIRLRWSTNATDFVVETTPTIGGPWQKVSNTVSFVGDHFSVTVTASQSSSYFRLRRQ